MGQLFRVPLSSVSIIDDTHLWFKSVAGDLAIDCQLRDDSMCGHVAVPPNPEVMVVEDTREDARFSQRDWAQGEQGFRFYAGAPLVGASGRRYGTLCVVDHRPRRFPPALLQTLVNFAELVVREMERDWADARERTGAEAREASRRLATREEPVALVDVGADGWQVLWHNGQFASAVGLPAEDVVGRRLWRLLKARSPDAPAALQAALAEGTPVALEAAPLAPGAPGAPPGRALALTLRPSSDALPHAALVAVPNLLGEGEGEPVRLSGESALSGGSGRRSGTSLWFATLAPTRRAGGDGDGLAAAAEAAAAGAARGAPSRSSFSSQRSSGSASAAAVTPLPPYDLARPARLADVRLGPLLGVGSFGRVHRGTWGGRPVAVKIMELPASELDDEAASGSDEARNNDGDNAGGGGRGSGSGARGARAAGGLKLRSALLEGALSREIEHPNVVATYDFAAWRQAAGAVGGGANPGGAAVVWLVQQYCDRGKLYDAIDRGWLRARRAPGGELNLPAVLATALDVASALEYLHSLDVLHGDLTGANVLLRSAPSDARGFAAAVADFGLARVAAETVQTDLHGTVSHMPPELLGQGELTKGADVYALGVLLWEMGASARAWAGRRPAQIVLAVTTGRGALPPPTGVPPRYAALVARCMAVDRLTRPEIGEVVAELRAMAAEAAAEAAAAAAVAVEAAAE
jgi:serine/threonine protein kinase